jgi:hypothetical protein
MYGWHSQTDMHTKPEYKHLVEELYLTQQEIYEDECLDNEPFLGNMWANINYKGGFNRPHIHLIHYGQVYITLRLLIIVVI